MNNIYVLLYFTYVLPYYNVWKHERKREMKYFIYAITLLPVLLLIVKKFIYNSNINY